MLLRLDPRALRRRRRGARTAAPRAHVGLRVHHAGRRRRGGGGRALAGRRHARPPGRGRVARAHEPLPRRSHRRDRHAGRGAARHVRAPRAARCGSSARRPGASTRSARTHRPRSPCAATPTRTRRGRSGERRCSRSPWCAASCASRPGLRARTATPVSEVALAVTVDVDGEAGLATALSLSARSERALRGRPRARAGAGRARRVRCRRDVLRAGDHRRARHPDAIRAIAAHGPRDRAPRAHAPQPAALPDDEQRREIEHGLAAFAALGFEPRGYRAPAWELTEATLALLAEHGFAYDSSLMDDDRPYELGAVTARAAGALDAGRRPRTSRPSLGSEALLRVWRHEIDLAAEERRPVTVTLHPEILGRPHRVDLLRGVLEHAAARGMPGADARGRSLLDSGDQVRDRPAQPAREPDHRAQLRVAPSPLEPRYLGRVHLGGRSDNASCVKPASSRRRRRFCANWSVGSTAAHAVAWACRTPGPEPQVAANRADSGASRVHELGAVLAHRASRAAAGQCVRTVVVATWRRAAIVRRAQASSDQPEHLQLARAERRPVGGPANADLGRQRRLRLGAQAPPRLARRARTAVRTDVRRDTARQHAGRSVSERVPRDGARIGVEEDHARRNAVARQAPSSRGTLTSPSASVTSATCGRCVADRGERLRARRRSRRRAAGRDPAG